MGENTRGKVESLLKKKQRLEMKHLNSDIAYELKLVTWLWSWTKWTQGRGDTAALNFFPSGLSAYPIMSSGQRLDSEGRIFGMMCVCLCRMLRIAKKVTEEGLCPDLATSFPFVEF